MTRLRGFTLIELLVALAILGILLTQTVGFGAEYLANAKVRTTMETLKEGLVTARMEAIRRNVRVEFVPQADGGWVVQRRASINEAPVVLFSQVAPAGNVAVSPANMVAFGGSGRTTPVGTTAAYASSSTVGCKADGGPLTCLSVSVSEGGAVRMCDPAATNEVYKCK